MAQLKTQCNAPTSPDAKLIIALVEAYTNATFNADTEAMRAIFHPKATMNGFLNGEQLVGDPEPFLQQLAAMPSLESSSAPYQAQLEYIDICGRTASVTLTEEGFGPMSFCNYLQLIKEGEQWLIINKTFQSS